MTRNMLCALLLSLVTAASFAADEGSARGLSRSSGGNDIADDTAVKEEPYLENESLVQVLRTTNKAQVNKFVCEALPFDNVNPYNVINYFWSVTSREEGGIYSYVHPTEARGYIVVICPEYQLPWLRQLARDLDRPDLTSSSGSKYIYYRMKHRNAADPSFRQVVSYYLGKSGNIFPDTETNSLLIFDAPKGAADTEAALNDFLDKPLKQIELQVRFYEMDVHNDAAIGLDYEAWKNGPGRNLAQYAARGRYFKSNSSAEISSSETGSGFYLDYPSAYFDFLVDKGKARSLVSTKITAVSGVPALITTGEQFLYYDVDNTDSDREVNGKLTDMATDSYSFPSDDRVFSSSDKPLGGGGLRGVVRSPFRSPGLDGDYPQRQYPQNNRPIDSTISAVDTGILLAVVPTIGEKMTNLDLNFRVVSVTGFDNEGTPLLNSRQMRDSIAVANGDEVVFGGFTRERHLQSTQKIPVLGSLPVLGYLFGREVSTQTKKVVVATVVPVPVIKHDNITEADEMLVRQASGDEVIVLPESEFCFDQSFQVLY